MTHDELQQRIFNVSTSPKREIVPDELGEALLAVTALHKPQENEYFAYKGEDGCAECGDRSYPCPTVLAIELKLQESF